MSKELWTYINKFINKFDVFILIREWQNTVTQNTIYVSHSTYFVFLGFETYGVTDFNIIIVPNNLQSFMVKRE